MKVLKEEEKRGYKMGEERAGVGLGWRVDTGNEKVEKRESGGQRRKNGRTC